VWWILEGCNRYGAYVVNSMLLFHHQFLAFSLHLVKNYMRPDGLGLV
jgi:hypothetical protein